jgi:hypothetical protein
VIPPLPAWSWSLIRRKPAWSLVGSLDEGGANRGQSADRTFAVVRGHGDARGRGHRGRFPERGDAADMVDIGPQNIDTPILISSRHKPIERNSNVRQSCR